MTYTTLEQHPVRSVSGVQLVRVVILVDAESDIPEPHNDWNPGSICMIANTHNFKVLNLEREWV